ncbi:MAG: OadG family protein [Clostridia bacterium]|nr:OadG family protein [Clostridia bacterium]
MDLITLAAKNFGNVADNMSEYGGKVTLSGLLIVFAMLVLLVVIISVFGFIIGGTLRSRKTTKAKAPEVEKKQEVVKTAVTSTNSTEDEEVIAVISAAVMMMYEGTGKTPIIRSIRPAQKGVRSAWASAGIMNNTRPF